MGDTNHLGDNREEVEAAVGAASDAVQVGLVDGALAEGLADVGPVLEDEVQASGEEVARRKNHAPGYPRSDAP
jgi:hypothetical protein